MCLIALAWGASERFPFVIAANRDEFLDRPTAALSTWLSPSGVAITGGRDLKDGGTWMGFTAAGRFAMLTNVRSPKQAPPANMISRGHLPVAWLESQRDARDWAAQIDARRYQGFNLIVGDWPSRQCHYLTNQEHLENLKPFEQIAGIESARTAHDLIANELPWGAVYGLSNAALDTPWPKTQQLKAAMGSLLDCSSAEQIFLQGLNALQNTQLAQAGDLPQTGVPQDWERALSSIFVRHPPDQPQYGTRSSLIAALQTGCGLALAEQTHAHHSLPGSSHAQAHLNWA